MRLRNLITAGVALLILCSCVRVSLLGSFDSHPDDPKFGNKHVLLAYVLGPCAPLLTGRTDDNNTVGSGKTQTPCSVQIGWQVCDSKRTVGSEFKEFRRSNSKLWLTNRAILI
jgi:hypothetical protein